MTPSNDEKRISVQFFVNDEEAAAIRDITKVDALGPAALSMIRHDIEDYRANAK